MQTTIIILLGASLTLFGLLWNRTIHTEYNEEQFEKWRKKWILRHPQYEEEIMLKELKQYGRFTAPLEPREAPVYLKLQKLKKNIAFGLSCGAPIITIVITLTSF